MNEKELRDSLLKSDAAAVDPGQLTARILDRDRRRVRLLTGLTVFFWLLTAAVILFTLFAYYYFVVPKQRQLLDNLGQARAFPLPEIEQGMPPEQFEPVVWANLQITQMGVKVVGTSVVALALAALSTVLLVFATRRATLRHINASLVEISEQLKQLRADSGK